MLPSTSSQVQTTQCCVQNAIKKYKQLGRFDDLKYTGRPKKLSNREIRHLKGLIKANSCLSASKIATKLGTSLPESITTRAIRRYSKDFAVEYVIKIKQKTMVKCPTSTTTYCLV